MRQYHPDTAKTEDEGISQDVAEAKFHAITNAYQTLREKGGGTDRLGELSSAEYDAEAEAIRKRFAQWEENMARRPTLPNDLERRRRALEADGSISLWKSDKTLYYLLGGAVSIILLLLELCLSDPPVIDSRGGNSAIAITTRLRATG